MKAQRTDDGIEIHLTDDEAGLLVELMVRFVPREEREAFDELLELVAGDDE